MVTRLVGTGIDAGKGGNRTTMSEPAHIPNLRHELRAEGIAHAAHIHHHGELGELR